MKEMDLENLAKQLHNKVHEKLLAEVVFKCDTQMETFLSLSESTRNDHKNQLQKELDQHVSALMKASEKVQDTHEKHLSHHHDRIMKMAEKPKKLRL